MNVNVNVTSGLPATPGNNDGPMPQSRGESAQEVPDPPTTGPWRVDLSQSTATGAVAYSALPSTQDWWERYLASGYGERWLLDSPAQQVEEAKVHATPFLTSSTTTTGGFHADHGAVL